MINLQQDADGFVRMSRHFPLSLTINVTFKDGTKQEFSGQAMNEFYDQALAEFRLQNNMDAKGFDRTPAKKIHRRNAVEFVTIPQGTVSQGNTP